MATENILMAAVAGGDRQELHERIRRALPGGRPRVKQHGLDNDLMARIAADPAFGLDAKALEDVMDPSKFIGRSPEITEEFLAAEVEPVLARHAGWKELDSEDLRV